MSQGTRNGILLHAVRKKAVEIFLGKEEWRKDHYWWEVSGKG